MAVTWADVALLDPTLAAVPVAAQAMLLADAAAKIDPDTWLQKYDLAWKYLAAHAGVLYLSGVGSAAGPITKKKVDEVETTYATPPTMADLKSTKWGVEFEFLLNGCLNARLFVLF